MSPTSVIPRRFEWPGVLLAVTLSLVCPAALAQTMAQSRPAGEVVYDCYEPIPGGLRIRLTADSKAKRLDPKGFIGAVRPDQPSAGNPRLHRRPLYPPADRANVFTPEQLPQIERCGFRPLVLAYGEPRFLFDFHSAGGLLGHLQMGVVLADGSAKWLHQCSELEVSYTRGGMGYLVRDAALPGITVKLDALPLADQPGLVARVEVEGLQEPARLVWAYGGACAFFTNWAMTAPEFNYQPGQCERNRIRWDTGRFSLTRGFEKPDAILEQVFAVPRYIKGWEAVIQGGSSFDGRRGFGQPAAFSASPAELAASANWDAGHDTDNVVALEEVPVTQGHARGFIAIGMGLRMAEVIRNPEQAYTAALTRGGEISGRIVTRTPDPHLDAAMTMLSHATEGTWADSAVAHGGWSWRFAYLGWRHWYGMDVYGWPQRIADSIRTHVRLNRVAGGPDEGALGSLLEYSPGVYYNMNEVFIDQVRHYFDYTADLELMREIYPVLEGILAWEDRRLRPAAEPLYENALNTWISDQHWYIRGQCTQASAYMLGAHSFMADLAKRLGRDPAPHAERAAAIRAAMQRTLWQPRVGVFAEYLDTRGNRLLHPEPELPTLYHSAEFGAADPLQVWQMLHWAATHLGTEPTPQGGRLYWSSNWAPNMGRSYTHSTYELAYAEELNFALTQYLAGRGDEAWALIRGCLAGVFSGPTPGGLSCHSYADGRQRANDEFADASSMWGRTIVEGLFGIIPHRPDGRIELSPQLPESWPEASIRTPHFSYELKREAGLAIAWTSPVPTTVRLRLPVRAASITEVLVDGRQVPHTVEAGVDLTWVTAETFRGLQGTIQVAYEPRRSPAAEELTVTQGQMLTAPVQGASLLDPQQCLAGAALANSVLTGKVVADAGPHVLFVTAGNESAPYLQPVPIRVVPAVPAPPKRWTRPAVPDRDLDRWALVDLSAAYNASLSEVMGQVVKAVKPPALPASAVNTGYYCSHLVAPFVTPPPSDEAWRRRIGEDGIGWTTEGIPFKSPKQGDNIAVVTRAAVFPSSIEFPVQATGGKLYLMLSGTTFAVQSHVVNLRMGLEYTDGSVQTRDLVNPFDIGDCWNQYRFHDTAANGFENLGGRTGPAGSAQVADLTRPVAVDTQAHLVAFDLKPGATLAKVRLEAVAEDIIFGVMGATVLR